MTITALYGALAPIPGGRLVFGAVMTARIAWRNVRCQALQLFSGLPDPVGRWCRHRYADILRTWRADVLEMEAIADRLD